MKNIRRISVSCLAVFGVQLTACTIVPAPDEGPDATHENDSNDDSDDESSDTSGPAQTSGGVQPDTNGGKPSTASPEETSEPHDGGGAEDETTADSDESEVETSDPTEQTPADAAAPVGKPDFECGTPDLANAKVLSGSVYDDAVWSGTVVVEGNVNVQGAKVTIEPGTHFIMQVDSHISFGWNSGSGTVKANGTPEQPITFCGESDEPGSWGYVEVDTVTSDSVFHNVLVKGAGGEGGAVRVLSELDIQNLVIEDSKGYGISASVFREGSSGLFVSGSQKEAAIFTQPAAATQFPAGSSLVGNTQDIVVLSYYNVPYDTIYHNLGVPYLQEGEIRVGSGVSLTIEAGVEVQVAADALLDIDGNADAASLFILGTESEPVVFRGLEETPGFWRGLSVGDVVSSNSTIDHLIVKHGGGGGAYPFRILAPIVVNHLTLEDNAGSAFIGAPGLKAGSVGWQISGSQTYPLTVEAGAIFNLPADSHYVGNTTDRVLVDRDYIDAGGTIAAQDVPYEVAVGLSFVRDHDVTIAAGATFLMGADTWVTVGENSATTNLTIAGTEEAPVVFKGLEEVAGYWRGWWVGSDILTSSSVDWLEIRHAGGGTEAALVLYMPLEVTNSTFADSASYGILRGYNGDTDYTATNTFANNALGNVGD